MSWLTAKLLGYVSGALLLVCLGLSAALYVSRAQVATVRAEAKAERAANAQAIAEANEAAQVAAREAEQRHAQQLAQVAEQYEQDKRDAQRKADGVVAELRAGNRRLRVQWQGCQAERVPGASTPAREPDAADRLREDGVGRILGAVAACQAQRDGLIRALEAGR